MDPITHMLHTPVVTAEHLPVVEPIYQTTLFRMPSHAVAVHAEQATRPTAYYTRWGNPTTRYLEDQLCALSSTDGALIFPSGMAAIATTLLTLAQPGATVAVSTRLYGDTTRFIVEELPLRGVHLEFFDSGNQEDCTRVLAGGCQIMYVETLSNPELTLADLAWLCRLAQRSGTLTVCDATFTPPGNLRMPVPGMDVVLHSLSKYIGGHYAVSGGAVLASASVLARIWQKQILYGACIDPHAAWLLSQGVKTLGLRLQRQNASALAVAQYLAAHEAVASVRYPMLASDPQYALAQTLLAGGGGVIAFTVHGGMPAAIRLIENTKVIGLSVSVGGIHSCIEHAQSMSHSMLSTMVHSAAPGPVAYCAPEEALLRLSVGIEEPADLMADLAQAFAAIQDTHRTEGT